MKGKKGKHPNKDSSCNDILSIKIPCPMCYGLGATFVIIMLPVVLEHPDPTLSVQLVYSAAH